MQKIDYLSLNNLLDQQSKVCFFAFSFFQATSILIALYSFRYRFPAFELRTLSIWFNERLNFREKAHPADSQASV